MKRKLSKIQGVSLILLLSMLNGNILSMQESQSMEIDQDAQAMVIDQNIQQGLSLSSLPAEVIRYIIYQIVKPYEDNIEKVDNVNNIFEFYSQIDLKQLRKDLVGVVRASKDLRLWALDLISRLKTLKEKKCQGNKYQELVTLIKYQYQGLSKDELNNKLRDILNRLVINRDNLEEAAKLILAGGNVNVSNKYRNTTLRWAARFGHKDIVQLLIDNKADVNIKNKYGDTVLMWAAGNGHADIVQLLIDNSANVNEKNNYGNTALMWAVIPGYKDIVQLLIDSGANVNQKNSVGSTALTFAVSKGYKDIVQLFLDSKANVDIKDNTVSTALMWAAMSGHADIVQLLEQVAESK